MCQLCIFQRTAKKKKKKKKKETKKKNLNIYVFGVCILLAKHYILIFHTVISFS